jgi:DNA repair exonuclease SbcCD ATPase subunit
MRIRWIVALLALPALVFSAVPAQAGTPIRTTTQYQDLKDYVAQLAAEKNQEQTPAQIAKYRGQLSKKNQKARTKVRSIYQQTLRQIKQRKAERKSKVATVKQKRNRQVSELKAALQSRLNAIAADRRAAVARINTSYATKQQALSKQLNKARKRLAKAKNPVVRENLREQISAIQDQIATLNREKQADLRVANNKYDDQADNARENYAQRIERTTEEYNARIDNLQERLRALYQQAKQNARQHRANDFGVVKSKYDEGLGYIKSMPVQTSD